MSSKKLYVPEDRFSNSMLVWYPLIKNELPTPKTVMIEVDTIYVIEYLDGKNGFEKYEDKILSEANKIGFPLFMRTDQTSNKHSWEETCYVKKEDELLKHLYRICEFSYMVDILGLEVKAVVLREFLELKSVFKAFNGMPVAREFRCFATDGKIDCIHPYWFEEAIEFKWDKDEYNKVSQGLSMEKQIELYDNPPEPLNWREKLIEMNKLSWLEEKIIIGLAEKCSRLVGGSWSVDVCNTVDGRWLITDMALGDQSYHYPHQVNKNE